MILYYFPILRLQDSQLFIFRDVYACICMRTYFNIFSAIYWSDTSLPGGGGVFAMEWVHTCG